jgi:Zn finger protein HypA/HybF involved in hydrogenase expression
MSGRREFQEIAHCGGQVIFTVSRDDEGRRRYQITWQSSRPVPAALYAIYALREGIPVADLPMGGVGSPWPEPPVPGCVPVFVASDSEGKFGFQCPRCGQYWRTRGGITLCPYCGLRTARHEFLSAAQRLYVRLYCERLDEALAMENDGIHVIDMDAVADAAGKNVEKPPFYYAEESQQKQFNCSACGEFNDILGRFAYCSVCGTRNDLSELEESIIPSIRDDLNRGALPSDCLKNVGSAFDTFVGQYAKQLIRNRPMRSGRRERIDGMRFHDIAATRRELSGGFDIDICEGLTEAEISTATRSFQRRHVYEHNGGEVDEKYLRDSGDTSVRLKQSIRETQAGVHEFANAVLRMARNLHRGFHDIYEPAKGAVERYEAEKKRLAALQRQNEGRSRSTTADTAKPHLKGQ